MSADGSRPLRPATDPTCGGNQVVGPASAVQVRDLRVTRGNREVPHGLSFDIRRGSVTGLIGPSGGGRTTLMRAITLRRRTS